MENIISQADTAAATMRTLPWLAPSGDARSPAPRDGRCGSEAPTMTRPRAISTSAAGSYVVSALLAGTCAAITTDHTIAWGMDVDHKFSTRLGPSASPPV
jgi:hypothetical protein